MACDQLGRHRAASDDRLSGGFRARDPGGRAQGTTAEAAIRWYLTGAIRPRRDHARFFLGSSGRSGLPSASCLCSATVHHEVSLIAIGAFNSR